MSITVAICTRNRAESLEMALSSIEQCETDGVRDWEVRVVDNGSTDGTQDVLADFKSRLPLQIELEEKAGLSNARNRVVATSERDWILWTDDDVSVDRQWLRGYQRGIDAHPQAAILGGPIEIEFDGSPPDWLKSGLPMIRGAYAGLGAGDIPARLSVGGPTPYGANFALRASALGSMSFDPELGRQPGRPTMSGEETRVIRALLAAGETGYWLPDARVRHRIDPSRQTIEYLRSYYRDLGILQILESPGDPKRRRVVDFVRSLTTVCLLEARLASPVFSSRGAERTTRLRAASIAWGRVRGHVGRLLE